MLQAPRPFLRLRNCATALMLGWALAAAALPAASGDAQPRPAIPEEQLAQLARLSYAEDIPGLRSLMQALEQDYDTESLATFSAYRALLYFHDEKSQQGLQELRKSLSIAKQRWQESPNAEHGNNYAFVLDLQGELLEKQARKAESLASRDLAHQIALQALGPAHLATQWLLYKRMYAAIANSRYPQAQQLFRQLQQSLPKPLNKCTKDICLSMRFQAANLASTMGDHALAMRIAKELMPDLKSEPRHAVWNVYQLVHLSGRLKRDKDLQHWCAHAEKMASQPQFANLDGMNRAIAKCLLVRSQDADQLDDLLEQEIKLRGAGSDGSTYMLLQKAESLGQNNRPHEAAQAAAQALGIVLANDNAYWQWSSQYTLAEALGDMQRMPEAIYYAKQAINVQQRLLADAKGLTPAQRETILSQGGEIYEDLANWLLQGQRFSEAEQTLTLAREQSYHQLVRSYLPSQRALELTPEEQQRHEAMQAMQSTLRAAWQGRENDSASLRQALNLVPKSLDQRMAQPQPAQAGPTYLRALAPHQTEVRYLPAQEHVYVVIRRGNQADQHLRLPIAQNQLTQDIALLRRALQQRGSTPQTQAHKLYKQLWQPLTQWLPAPQPGAATGQAPEVRVHLEGALRYLPMAALHDGRHWLGESYALPQDTGVQASAPAIADTTAALQRDGWSLQGSSRATANLPALPKVREEIEGLAQLASTRGIGHDQQQDDAFTADSLRAALQSRKVVHLASHFRLLPGNGQASGLYLGNGKLLTLGELSDPSFRFEGLDLLTLSACETAVPSGPAEQGLPVDSLAWLAQARGARNVLASLWAVADEGTQELMHAFYSALAQGMPHAQALRAAQLVLLSSEGKASQTQKRGLVTAPPKSSGDTLAHPYYWSGFVLLAATQ